MKDAILISLEMKQQTANSRLLSYKTFKVLCDRTRKLNSLDNLKIDFTEDFLHLKDNISLKYSF